MQMWPHAGQQCTRKQETVDQTPGNSRRTSAETCLRNTFLPCPQPAQSLFLRRCSNEGVLRFLRGVRYPPSPQACASPLQRSPFLKPFFHPHIPPALKNQGCILWYLPLAVLREYPRSQSLTRLAQY